MLRSLLELVGAWWRTDRIRVSPAEGRLLRLRRGSVVRLREQTAVVRQRWVGRSASGPYVNYDCEVDGGGGPCQLRVGPVLGSGPHGVTWTRGGKEDAVPPEDIEVFAASGDR